MLDKQPAVCCCVIVFFSLSVVWSKAETVFWKPYHFVVVTAKVQNKGRKENKNYRRVKVYKNSGGNDLPLESHLSGVKGQSSL